MTMCWVQVVPPQTWAAYASAHSSRCTIFISYLHSHTIVALYQEDKSSWQPVRRHISEAVQDKTKLTTKSEAT